MKIKFFLIIIIFFIISSNSETIKVTDHASFYKHISKGDYDELIIPDGMIITDSFNIINPKKNHKIIGEGTVEITSLNEQDWVAIKMNRDRRNWNNLEPEITFENINFRILYKIRIFEIEKNLNVIFKNCNFTGFFHSEELMRNNGSNITFENCNFKSFNYILFNKLSENKSIIFKNCVFEKIGTLVDNLESKVNIIIKNIEFKGKSSLPLIIMTSSLEPGYFVDFDQKSIEKMEDPGNMLILFPIKQNNSGEEDKLYFYDFNKEFWDVMDNFILDFYLDIDILDIMKKTKYNYSEFSVYMKSEFEKIAKKDIDRQSLRKILNFSTMTRFFKIAAITEYTKPEDKLVSFDILNVLKKVFKDKYKFIFYPYFNTLIKYKTKTASALLALRKEIKIDGENSQIIQDLSFTELIELIENNLKDLEKMAQDKKTFDTILKNEVPVYLSKYFNDDKIFTKKVQKNILDISVLDETSDKLNNMLYIDFPISLLMANIWLKGQESQNPEEILKIAKILSEIVNKTKEKITMPAVEDIIKKTAIMLKSRYDKLNK
ncbi:MAG: hypothetical protein M0R46_00080 [Candidatus Muirbacterium halophilum]|nr:hypothetical protein [Candidatus Muirbacterium halophilum]MCK9474289.1 hypothetical protein [Candidatus Muirbacterium halophilum]